jgi:DNA-binding NarL/FixJ family response regulator
MDIGLPVLDGIEATRLIAMEMPEVRVIGLSMFEDEAHRAAMRSAGAVDCLDKSASLSSVAAAVRRHARVVPQ